jgi:hypothetical protein
LHDYFILSQTWYGWGSNPIIFEYALDLAKTIKKTASWLEILWTQMYKSALIWD